jgi:conjugative relaxase-like TrwC/TraI family protein
MLRVTAIANSEAAKAYFKSADYYIEGQESPSFWNGKGAELLGLSGEVDYRDFEKLCDNINPATGRQLTAKHLTNRRVGYDFTFSLPKSLSLAYSLGGDERIASEFQAAVADTMGLIEREMETRVRKEGANENRRTGNMLWTAFTHHTSRPIGGYPDPQLHVHAVAFNATFDKAEGQWKAGEFAAIKANGPYFQAAFRARLAERVQNLGYDIRRTKDDFELVGVPERTLKEFSRRTTQIDKLAERLGVTRPETKAKLGATSRENKREDQTWPMLMRSWEKRLQPGERQEVNAAVRDSREMPMAMLVDNAGALDWAIRHEFERASVISQRRLVTTALKHGLGSVTLEGLYEELGKRKDLIRRADKGDILVSTQGVLAEEKAITAFAVKGRGRFQPLSRKSASGLHNGLHQKGGEHSGQSRVSDLATPSPYGQAVADIGGGSAFTDPGLGKRIERSRQATAPAPSQAATALGDRATLSPSQQAAIRHVWHSRDRLILIRGAAGTGKTTLTRTALAGIDAPWVILAPSAEASRGVLRRDGFADADTLARFLADEKFQEKARNGVIWLDEASLAGAHDIFRLVQLADSLGAKIVLSGDRRQHKSVSRGDVLALLEDRAGLPVAVVSEIKRQSGEYRQAVQALARGDTADGFRRLDELGWVKEAKSSNGVDRELTGVLGSGNGLPENLLDHAGGTTAMIAADYLAAVRDGKSVLVVSPTHAEGEAVTAAIREKLKQDGRLKGEERTFERLVPLHLTEAERSLAGAGTGAASGDVAKFFRASGKFKAGQQVPLSEVGDLGRATGSWAAYRPDSLSLAAGDSIRITANGKTLDGHRLNNGASYTVAGFTDNGDIRLGNGWLLGKDFGHISHGYVSTSHGSQGKTVDVALIAMGNQSLGAMGSEQFYVSASRARQKTLIYVEDKETVLDAIQKDDRRMLASELVRMPPKNVRDRLKSRVRFLRELGNSLGQRVPHIAKQPERSTVYDRE